MRTKTILTTLRKLDILKTIRFNFHYFPLRTAIRFPVFVYWKTLLLNMHGKIEIKSPVSTGMVRLGPHGLGTQDVRFERTIWEVSGTLVLGGKAQIGRGTKISIGKNGTLKLGGGYCVTGGSEIICHEGITFGDDCLVSWDVLIMDTDFHHILDADGNVTNSPNPIYIGNHVWIGCRNTILKGVSIGDHNIISANSTITRSFEDSHCIIGGHGKQAGIIRRCIDWKK